MSLQESHDLKIQKYDIVIKEEGSTIKSFTVNFTTFVEKVESQMTLPWIAHQGFAYIQIACAYSI